MNRWLGSKRNTSIYDEVLYEREPGFPMTVFRILAYLFASMWYGFMIGAVYKSITTFLNMQNFYDCFKFIFWTAMAIILLPRFYRYKKVILNRQEYPALYQAVDEVAAFLNAPPIDGIVVNRAFQASYTITGIRRKKLLTIGLPLFASLTVEEKLAILGHELGHHANKDITRSSFFGGVQRSLGRLYWSIIPKTDYSEMFSFVAKLQEWVRIGLSYPVLLVWYAMGFAVWKDSQKAEYYADYAAAAVAGTSAAASALNKLYYAPTFRKTLHMIAQYEYSSHLFEEYRNRVRSIPPREVERIRLLTELSESSVESTHPPIRYRVGYMEEKRPSNSPVIARELLDRIAREFSDLEAIWEKRMVTDYRSHLYHR